MVARTDNERTIIIPAKRKGVPIRRANAFVNRKGHPQGVPLPQVVVFAYPRGQPRGLPLREAEAGYKPALPEVVGGCRATVNTAGRLSGQHRLRYTEC